MELILHIQDGLHGEIIKLIVTLRMFTSLVNYLVWKRDMGNSKRQKRVNKKNYEKVDEEVAEKRDHEIDEPTNGQVNVLQIEMTRLKLIMVMKRIPWFPKWKVIN